MNYIEYMSGGGSAEGKYTIPIDLLEKTGIPSSMQKTNHQILTPTYDAIQKFKTSNAKNTPVVASGAEPDNDSNLLTVYHSEQPIQYYNFAGAFTPSYPRMYWTSSNQ